MDTTTSLVTESDSSSLLYEATQATWRLMFQKQFRLTESKNSKSANLVQINLRHAQAASVELTKRLAKTMEIALITEPWIRKGDVKGLENLKVFSKGSKPRAIIAAHRNTKVMLLDDISEDDIVCCTLCTSEGLVYLASAYWDILSNESFLSKLGKVAQLANEKKAPLIIGMDSNAHSILWGCKDSDRRGKDLEDFILNQGLYVENVGNEPTFETCRAKSIIDVTLTNARGNNIVFDWKVDKESVSMSDHKYILYGIRVRNHVSIVQKRRFHKMDWRAYKEDLKSQQTPEVGYGIDGIEESTQWLHDRIWSNLKSQCPKVLVKDRRNNWWNHECDIWRHKVRILLRRRNKDKYNEELRLELKSANKEYKKALFKAKESGWARFVEQLENTKDVGRVAKALRNPNRREIGALCQGGPRETLTKLMDTHFPDCRSTRLPPGGLGFQRNKLVCQDSMAFTLEEVKASLKSFGDSKAAGADGIPPKALKELPDEYFN